MNQKIKLLVIATLSLLVSNASFGYGADFFVVNGLAYADPLNAKGTNCKRVYYQDEYADQLSGAVTIPATVTYNGTTYTVTEMGDNCFYGCSKITSVQLGANIQYVCTGAFSGCTNLSYIICKASTPPSFPTSGISSPFPSPSPSQLILYVTDSKVSTYQGTSGWNQFKVVTGENNQTTYGITLNQSTLSLEKGKTSTLSATKVPSFSTGTITWSSSDTNVATVSQGTVTAVGSGSATITASCNGYSATCRVSVSSPVKSISLSFAAMGMERGQSSTLSVTYTPSDADGRSVTWKSSNTSVATVSNGTVTAVGIGSATITATTPNGKTATCGVSVGQARVDLGLPSGTLWAEMNVGSTTPSDPGSYFAWGETTTKSSYTWASLKYCNNGSSSSFSKYTTAGAELSTSDDAAYSVMGSSWKTPSSSELQELIDLCTIESTTIDGQAGYLMTGPNGNTIFLPKNGYKYASSINDGGNCAEYWSRTLSNDIGWANELHIGATGSNITGFSRQYGAGVRPVAANKASRTIATAISMSSTLSLAKGNSSTITVTFTPSSVSSKLLKWVSDNNSVATVDGNGKVTAVASGTAHITATTYDGSNISKTCTVTVTSPISSISLIQTSLNLIKGGTSTLTVTYNPTDADSRSVTWNSSNTSVATISTSGVVTAVAAGTAVITATTSNGKQASCEVTVTNPVSSISLSQSTLELTTGGISTLEVTYTPADADSRSVTWSSSNTSVATVSTDGLVTAVASGNATITATSANGKTATCTVTVTNPVSSISLSQSTLELTTGGTSTLEVIYTPADADSRSVTWSSSNTSVATVSTDGLVTAVAAGTAVITATSANGKTASCSVEVVDEDSEVVISLSDWNAKMYNTERAANPPADNWYSVDFDDSSWTSLIGQPEFPVYQAFWIRRKVYIAGDPASYSFSLKIRHDDEAIAYVNGTEVYNRQDCTNDFRTVQIPASNLHSGENLIAVYVYDSGGGDQYIDFDFTANVENVVYNWLTSELSLQLSQERASVYCVDDEKFNTIHIYPLVSKNFAIVDTPVTWTSSDASVVTVSDGEVHAVGAGTATITASVTVDGETVSAQCIVQSTAFAEGVKVVFVEEAGTLPSLITDEEKYTLTDLAILGPLNGTDIRYIREMAGRDYNDNVTKGKLRSLDMKAATIVSGGEQYISWCGTVNATIGDKMFCNCQSLTSVTIPESVTSIGSSAFSGCSSLTSVTIPESVTSIGDGAFSGCSSLTSLTIPDGVTSIEYNAFSCCSSLTSLTIPESVTSIGGGAFAGCSSLTSLTIPESVTSIGEWAFDGCSSLTSLTIPAGVTSIGESAFYCCSSLTSLTIPDGVTSIGERAFDGCSSLTSLTIPESVTSIGYEAFGGCSSLTSVTMDGSVVPTLSSTNAFPESASFIVPDDHYDAYCTADIWKDMKTRIVPLSRSSNASVTIEARPDCSALINELGEDALPYIMDLTVKGTINGYDIMAMRNKMLNLQILDLSEADIVANDNHYEYYTGQYLKEDNQLGDYAFSAPQCKLVSVKLPNSLTYIGDYAFSANRSLRDITLPENVSYLGSYAFHYCTNLRSIVIPDKVNEIKQEAFSACDNLKTVSVGKSVSAIGWYAFSGCGSLTSISFPISLKKIEGYAFQGCSSLAEVRIPSSVNSIADNVFSGCDNLKDVYVYVIEPQSIGQNTFTETVRTTATLHTPSTSHMLYYYNTQWSQFQSREDFDEPYEYFFLDHDYTLDDEDNGRIDGDPDAELNEHSGLIVEGDEEQGLGEIDINHDGTDGPSIIGDDNITAESMKVNVILTGRSWKFFCFPFDIAYSNITLVPDNEQFAGDFVLYTYDGSLRATGQSGWVRVEPTETLTAGKGYIIQGSTNGTLQITVPGTALDFSAADKAEEMAAHAAADDADASWNFMGNPYLSYYDLDALAEQFDSPLTVWDGNQYLTYRPGDDNYQLHPFEAFFVQKPEKLPDIQFKGNNRITYTEAQNANAAKASRMREAAREERSRFLINLTLSDGTTTDRTRVVFNEKASKDYEMECDAAKFESLTAIPQLWTIGGSTRYAINERPAADGTVALGYEATADGTLSISAQRMDAGVELVDHANGTVHDFKQGDYTFLTEAGTFTDRFTLRLAGTTAIDGVKAEANDASEYFTTGGQRTTDAEAKGVVIVKQGDKATKTIGK